MIRPFGFLCRYIFAAGARLPVMPRLGQGQGTRSVPMPRSPSLASALGGRANTAVASAPQVAMIRPWRNRLAGLGFGHSGDVAGVNTHGKQARPLSRPGMGEGPLLCSRTFGA
jgi:hypothetical protein